MKTNRAQVRRWPRNASLARADGTGFIRASARAHRTFGLALLLAFAPAVPALAASVTLQQGLNGYTNAADAYLDEGSKTRNYGGSTYVRVQYNEGMSDCALLRFSLPSLSYQSLSAATLGLYYYDQSSMTGNNAVGLKPYRIKPGTNWFENIYDGTAGYGVNWRYRDAAQTNEWTGQYGAWHDKLDDGNPPVRIKPVGGSATNAIPPTNWVTWNVLNSVAQWHAGQENSGFVLFQSSFEGSGSIAAGLFYSREYGTTSLRPYLSLAYQGAQIGWAGYASGAWDSSAVNWNVGGYRGAFGAGDFVTFADGAGNPSITVAGAGVSPGSVTVTNAGTAYSFAGGAIGGSGTLTKSGTGCVTLSASNSYAGLTTVRAGTLVVAANSALGGTASGTVVSNGAALGFQGGVNYTAPEPLTIEGTGPGGSGALHALSGSNVFAGPVTLSDNTTLSVGSALALTLNGAVSGTGTLTKTGAGRLTLGASNPCRSDVLVNEGTLALAGFGSLASSPTLSLKAGAAFDVSGVTGGFTLGGVTNQTLKGSGAVAGNVSAASLARLEPGSSAGTLTFQNNLTLHPAVTNYFELTNSPAVGGGTNDLIIVAGDLTVSDNVIAVTVLGLAPLGEGTYRLFNYNGQKRGSFNPAPVILGGSIVPGLATIDESVTNQVNLVVLAETATALQLASSQNPSLPGAAVTFTATVSTVPPSTNMPTGVVVFKTNGVPLGGARPLIGGVAQIQSTELPHGFCTARVEYAGEGRFLGSTNSLAQLVNTPPVPGAHFAGVAQDQPLILSIAKLVCHDFDADGDPLAIIGVSPLSTNGGTAALVGGTNLVYLPKPDYLGRDRITYTLSDSYTTVEVPVTIEVMSGGAQSLNIVAITNLGGGTMQVTFAGIPGYAYWVQMATNLSDPVTWITLGTNTAGTNGLWLFTDRQATNRQQFYRSAAPPTLPAPHMFDAEILSFKLTGGLPPGLSLRESPTLSSVGVTRIQPQDDGSFTISSFFDLFTEVSTDGGIQWHPGTNGPGTMVLMGGVPPNGFATNTLPPLLSQYQTLPAWTEFYPLPGGMVYALRDLRLHVFTTSFPPPPPGTSVTNRVNCMTDLQFSFNGGLTFMPVSASGVWEIVFSGRPEK